MRSAPAARSTPSVRGSVRRAAAAAGRQPRRARLPPRARIWASCAAANELLRQRDVREVCRRRIGSRRAAGAARRSGAAAASAAGPAAGWRRRPRANPGETPRRAETGQALARHGARSWHIRPYVIYEQAAPGAARQARRGAMGSPLAACRGFGAQPRVDNAVPARACRGFGAQPHPSDAAQPHLTKRGTAPGATPGMSRCGSRSRAAPGCQPAHIRARGRPGG